MSGKNAVLPQDFDWVKSQAKIMEVIEALPNTAGCEVSSKLQAKEVLVYWRHPSLAPSGRYARASEIKKLKELRKAARKLASIWKDIDPEILTLIGGQASKPRFEGVSGWTSTAERDIMQFLVFGPELLDRTTKDVETKISDGLQSGRRHYAVIRIIESCARTWEERTGKRPKSGSHVAFCAFVEEVLAAIGVDTVTINTAHTIRSWAELKSE